MSVSFHDRHGDARSVKLTNSQYEQLQKRGVLMPAGVFSAGGRHYVNDRHHADLYADAITASVAEARACGMAMRTYADAVRCGTEKRREWVETLDRSLCDCADELVEFFATCNGFETH